MSKDFLDSDLFAPMTEEEVNNFDNELLPKNTAKRADEVSLSESVKDISKDFEHLFTK
jgi:hypothetical protein